MPPRGIAYRFEYTGCGVVYKLSPSGQEAVLYTFTGGADGGNPVGGVILDSAGNLYGTTADGGTPSGYSGNGVVFKLTPAGQETVLYTFTGGSDGGTPDAGLVFDSQGNHVSFEARVDTSFQVTVLGVTIVIKFDISAQVFLGSTERAEAGGGVQTATSSKTCQNVSKRVRLD